MGSRLPTTGLVLSLLLLFPASGWTADLSEKAARDRARELLSALPFFSGEGHGRYRMVVEGQNGKRFEREFVVEARRIKGSLRRRIDVVSPADLAGRAFLFVSHPKGPDACWMYVSAFETTKEIEGTRRHGSFLRSHLTYRDVFGFRWADASFDEVRTGEVDGEAVADVRVEPGEADKTEYDRAEVSIRASDGAPLQCILRSGDDSVEKTLELTSFSGSGSDARIAEMTIRPKAGGYTRLELRDFQPKPTRPRTDFQPEQLAGSDGPTQP